MDLASQHAMLPTFFVSADWSKDESKRSVHVADLDARRIRREVCAGWNLKRLLELAGKLARRGSVLVGVDAALGVPAGYWRAVQTAQRWGSPAAPAGFVDWLGRLDPGSEFFEEIREPREWSVERPFFRVPGRRGGLRGFTEKFHDGFLRPIDRSTGAKPIFAVSGIPGTVGSGTRALWQELIPLLRASRHFAVWPFEGELPDLLSCRGVVLAETYPGLAYAAALANDLPACRLKIAKTKSDQRKQGCDLLQTMSWVREGRVNVGDLDPALVDEDAFDSHFTAAAILRCSIAGLALCDRQWIDCRPGGAMLLAGPVDPSLRARTMEGKQSTQRPGNPPSGPSHHNLRIDGLEFTARIVDLHLPVDSALRAIDVGGPRRDLAVQRPEVADAAPA